MVGCFDASGHESDRPFLVVAGFVSSAGHWDEFSQEWLKRLAEDGLTYFHAGEFKTSSKSFHGWRGDEDRRRALSRDLMDLIQSNAYRSFVSGVKISDLKHAFTAEERIEFNINAYALCGRYCVADLARWMRGDNLKAYEVAAPDLIFEHGDIGKGKLTSLLEKRNYPRPDFRPGKRPLHTAAGVIQPFVPLQAADWLAFEAFQLLLSGHTSLESRHLWRWPMQQFERMVGSRGLWTFETLMEVKKHLDAIDKETSGGVILVEPLADGVFF